MTMCVECGDVNLGHCNDYGLFYCNDCWEYYWLDSYRCFTFAAVYDARNGKRLSTGGSIHKACAERQALWKLHDFDSPKAIVVCRIRKNRNNTKLSFGSSKPCAQCILSMQMYNVQHVCYSTDKNHFEWSKVDYLSTQYHTKCMTIVKL
jgi:cytidine deaminase